MNDQMSPSPKTLCTTPLGLKRLTPSTLRNPKLTIAALAVLALGFFLDSYTTSVLITELGFTEANPIVNSFYTQAGVFGVISYKTLLITLATGVVTWTDALRTEDAVNLCFACIGSTWLLAGLHNLQYVI